METPTPTLPSPAAAPLSDPDAGVPQQPTASSHAESLSFLQFFETMFLIDDSEHMKRQWLDVTALANAVAPVCLKYDENGIDVYFINHRPMMYFPGMSVRRSGYNHIGKVYSDTGKRDSTAQIFRDVKPGGRCRLGARLSKILTWYVAYLKEDPTRPPLNIIVITAGISSDDYTAPLIEAAKALDAMGAPEHQLGIMLFQLGDNEDVRRAFEHADDEMWKAAKTRDIVDTVAWRGWPAGFGADDMVKAVLGAVEKRMDAVKGHLEGKAPPVRRETEI